MKGVIITKTGEAVPTPQPDHLLDLLNNSPVRDFQGFGKLIDQYEKLKVRDDDIPSSPEDERGPTFDSPSGPPVSKLRRPSVVTLRPPTFPVVSSTSCPTAVPTIGNRRTSSELNEAAQSAPPLEKPTSIAPPVSETKGRSDVDEDDLPSPFLRRVERAGRTMLKPARRTSDASKALRTAAAANASNKTGSLKGNIVPLIGSRVPSAGRVSISPENPR